MTLECFASLDWGFNAKGICLWWLCLPDGAYHIRREYVFTNTPVDDLETGEPGVASKIKRYTAELGVKRLRYLVCDPSIWAKEGKGRGESIAETLMRRPHYLPCRRADNDRVSGWYRLHELLRPMPDGSRPWLTIDESCRYLRRTIPAMVQDKHEPDDLDTNKDDHGVDALRYGAMSRPSPTKLVREAKDVVGSLAWWRQYHQPKAEGVLA